MRAWINWEWIIQFATVTGIAVFGVTAAFWLLGWGRFSRPSAPRNQLNDAVTPRMPTTVAGYWGYVFLKLVVDFRHFLALVVFVTFAVMMISAFWFSGPLGACTGNQTCVTLDDRIQAFQAVVASLGGLIGSIIGYYFGEASKSSAQDSTSGDDGNISAVSPPPIVGQSGVEDSGSAGAKEPVS